jgi:hypothetical protein
MCGMDLGLSGYCLFRQQPPGPVQNRTSSVERAWVCQRLIMSKHALQIQLAPPSSWPVRALWRNSTLQSNWFIELGFTPDILQHASQ